VGVPQKNPPGFLGTYPGVWTLLPTNGTNQVKLQ